MHNSALSSLAEGGASTHCAYPLRDGQAELASVVDYVARWFIWPKAVTHLRKNFVDQG